MKIQSRNFRRRYLPLIYFSRVCCALSVQAFLGLIAFWIIIVDLFLISRIKWSKNVSVLCRLSNNRHLGDRFALISLDRLRVLHQSAANILWWPNKVGWDCLTVSEIFSTDLLSLPLLTCHCLKLLVFLIDTSRNNQYFRILT